MHPYLERLARLLDHLSLIVRGLRFIATVFLGFALLGGVLTMAGLLRAGVPWWLSIPIGFVVAAPAVLLWRFRVSLESAVTLPARIRGLPTSVDDVVDDMEPIMSALKGVAPRPMSPRAFARSVRGSKAAIDAFNESPYVQLVGGVAVLHPVALLAGTTATLFAAGSLAFGIGILYLGGLF